MASANFRNRYWLRLVSLVILAIISGVAVLALLNNSELEKMAPRSIVRDLAVILGPAAMLTLTNYQMGARSFGRRDLFLDLLVIATSYAWFLTIVLPFYFGLKVTLQDADCYLFGLVCFDEKSLSLNYWGFLALLALSIFMTLLFKRRLSSVDS